MLPLVEAELVQGPSSEVRASLGARPRIRGKFLYAGSEKLYVRGVTYGTFLDAGAPGQFPTPEVVLRDFASMRRNGINAVRTYTIPPKWLLDHAAEHGIYVMAGLPWEQHITFLDDSRRVRDIRARLRAGVRECASHPAMLAYAIGNEIPSPIVRWHGRRRAQEFLKSLYDSAKLEDPEGLVTYVNFPTTEYLELDFLDFVSFNVYLEQQDRLAAYLARLQNLAGERPLLMAEVGLDSRRNGEKNQAEVLDWQIRTAFSSGCAGLFVFAWTDEWHRGGSAIEDWDFGLVARDRSPKLALSAVRTAFSEVPFRSDNRWPRVSVVVCSYNGSRMLRETLEHISALDYPNYEVIVVNDGSTDRTPDIVSDFDVRLISTENGGLSNARNVGMRAASGEIVAYCDDDAYPDPHWLQYLAHTYLTTDYAGVGGPNLAPPGDGPIAEAVANAPGGPIHVLLSDTEAEHIPGCNSSYRRSCLLAVDGYDVSYRVAGDDVDLCWRIQQQGWKVGFHPAAVVWHHRRDSIKAYWKQQKGYGKAEALLERKWPEKYNSAGHLTWQGRLYGTGVLRAIGLRSRVYQGTWGSAPFQGLYEPAPGALQLVARMPEWYLLCAALFVLSALGAVWRPSLVAVPLLIFAVGLHLAQIFGAVAKAVFPSGPKTFMKRAKLHGITAILFALQPLARLWGRVRSGLVPWRLAGASGLKLPLPCSVAVWSEKWIAPEQWLEKLEALLKSERLPVIRGGDFDEWDLEIQAGLFAASRIVMGVEEHGGGKQNLRWRFWPRVNFFSYLPAPVFLLLSCLAAADRSWFVSSFLASVALAFVAWTVRDCALAQGAVTSALERLRSDAE